jgi:hypothetical protein
MEIKDRITKLGSYFSEMKVATVKGTQLILVSVSFPQNWIINDKIQEKFDVNVVNDTTPGSFIFVTPMENGENVVFDAIDYCIKSMEDAMERAKLLNEKVKELKAFFEDEDITLEELQTLTITYTKLPPELPVEAEEIIPLQTKKRGKKKDDKEDE